MTSSSNPSTDEAESRPSRRLDGMPLTDAEMAETLVRATLQVLAQLDESD